MKYFTCIESPLDLNKYTISVTDEVCKFMGPLKGSYNILPARILGLNYIDYIAYVLKMYGDKVKFNSWGGGLSFENKEDVLSPDDFLSILKELEYMEKHPEEYPAYDNIEDLKKHL